MLEGAGGGVLMTVPTKKLAKDGPGAGTPMLKLTSNNGKKVERSNERAL